MIKKLILLTTFVAGLNSIHATAAVTIHEGKILNVSMYEECMVVKFENTTRAFVYPITQPSFKEKFSIALAAFNSGKPAKVGYWGTSHCASLNSQEGSEPGGSLEYIYFIQQK